MRSKPESESSTEWNVTIRMSASEAQVLICFLHDIECCTPRQHVKFELIRRLLNVTPTTREFDDWSLSVFLTQQEIPKVGPENAPDRVIHHRHVDRLNEILETTS